MDLNVRDAVVRRFIISSYRRYNLRTSAPVTPRKRTSQTVTWKADYPPPVRVAAWNTLNKSLFSWKKSSKISFQEMPALTGRAKAEKPRRKELRQVPQYPVQMLALVRYWPMLSPLLLWGAISTQQQPHLGSSGFPEYVLDRFGWQRLIF